MAFLSSNLPCTIKKYEQMTEMATRAISFLTNAATGKPWEESQQAQLQGFNPSIYEHVDIAALNSM